MRQAGRQAGKQVGRGEPWAAGADTQTVQLVHGCIPLCIALGCFFLQKAALCKVPSLCVQDSESLQRGCLPLEVHLRQCGARLESHPAAPPKCFFISRPVWTPPAAFVPRTFRATQKTLSSCTFFLHRLLTAAVAGSIWMEDFGPWCVSSTGKLKPGLQRISLFHELEVSSMAELVRVMPQWQPPPPCPLPSFLSVVSRR